MAACSQGVRSENSADQNKRFGKKRKDQSEDEEEDEEGNGDEEDPSAQKIPRVVWYVELHRKFVTVINQLGLDSDFAIVKIPEAVPKKILDLMNVEGFQGKMWQTILRFKYLLAWARYRLYLKKAAKQASMVAALGEN
ncbi:hypothetical protein Fmac_026494 [Flemingia macrophylla]|uniref:Uncharacterized protein n=1 Tax=Flemingia macrophylla TaxID=520843 RepID=A0ABD1LGR5_9FABA